jgi:hypothetical protein
LDWALTSSITTSEPGDASACTHAEAFLFLALNSMKRFRLQTPSLEFARFSMQPV